MSSSSDEVHDSDEALARLITANDVEAARSGDDTYYVGKAVKAEPVPIYAEPEPMYYGTWRPPPQNRVLYQEDPFEVWCACMCLFFWFLFLLIVISAVTYGPYDDDTQ